MTNNHTDPLSDGVQKPAPIGSSVDADSYIQIAKDATEKFGHRSYGIVYRVFCSSSGISYVGQTTSLPHLTNRKANSTKKPARILSHYNALKRGLHPCQKLQAAWNKTSGKTFLDEVLEVVCVHPQKWDGKQKLSEREKYWQEKFKAETGAASASDFYYPIKAPELKLLQNTGLINNTMLVYFALKLKNPRCDRPLKVKPVELAIEWEIPESSVYEAIGRLKETELIQIDKAEIVIVWSDSQQAPPSRNPECITRSQNALRDLRMESEISENAFPEPPPPATFKSLECTNKNLNSLNRSIGSQTDAPSSLNRDELGTTAKTPNPYDSEIIEWLTLATTTGIKTNATISRTMAELRLQHDAAAARKIVENAISAVAEQIQRNKCKNPGGYLNAALRRGFTANGAKQARRRDHPPMQPPALNYAAGVVNQAIAEGKRGAAIAYLQTLWDSGFCDLIEEMIHLFRRDWQLSLTSQGVRDAAT